MHSKVLGIVAALSLIATQTPSFAANGQPSIAEIGDKACRTALFDPDFGDVSRTDYLNYIEVTGVVTDDYCACVASEFVENEDLQSFRMDLASTEAEVAEVFEAILIENLDACLTPFGTLKPGEQEAILAAGYFEYDDPIDGDLAEWEQDGIDWAADPHYSSCVLATEGTLEVPEFEDAGLDEWFEGSGLTALDLCHCVSPTLEGRIEDGHITYDGTTGSPGYWREMFSAVADCSYAMWNGRELLD